jgi:hypothetical protein
MSSKLTAEDFTQSLTAHASQKGAEVREKYGPDISWKTLLLLLDDRSVVRYPCELRFDSSALLPGEMAYPCPKGETPEDGFVLNVHPVFMMRPADVPAIALYQVAAVNYGDFASPADAEAFGAAALGLSEEDYYARLCELAQLVDAGSSSTSCGCGK